MLANFLFSLNVSLPIFILLLLGVFLRKKNILNDNFIACANTLIFNVCLPAKLFSDTMNTDFTQAIDWRFFLLLIGGTMVFYVLFWIIGAVTLKEPAKVGAFVHGTIRGNFVYIGYPLIQNILGLTALPAEGMLASAFILPLYNVLAVVVLTVTNNPGKKIDFGKILLSIIKNPMILGILAGLPFSFIRVKTGFEFPFAITKSLGYLGNLVTPLALIVIGASTRFTAIRKSIKPIGMSCFFRLVLQPLIIIPLAVAMGLGPVPIVVLFVVYAVPAAANVYIVTQKMGGDADLAAGIVIGTVAASMFTMTLGIFLLKTLAII